MPVKKLLTDKRFFQILFWGWLIFILALSSIPGLPVPEKKIADIFRIDYLIHLVQYFILAFFYIFSQKKSFFPPRQLFYFWILGAAIGAIDEIHQIFILGRAFNIIDMGLNAAGFLLGLIFSAYLLLIIFPADNEE